MLGREEAYKRAKGALQDALTSYYGLFQVKENLESESRTVSPAYIDCLAHIKTVTSKITEAVAQIESSRELNDEEKRVLAKIKEAKKISVKELSKALEKPYKDTYTVVLILERLRYVNTKWFPEVQELRVYPLQYEY